MPLAIYPRGRKRHRKIKVKKKRGPRGHRGHFGIL